MNKKVLGSLANIVGVSVSDLTSAIENENDELNFDIAKTFNSSEWSSFEKAIQTEKDSEYNKGKDVGERQFIRDAKQEIGLDYDGKDGKMFLEKFREKVVSEMGDSADERVKTLTNDLSILRENSEKELQEVKTKLEETSKNLNSVQSGAELQSFVPNAPNGLSVDDAMFLMKKDLVFDLNEDGQKVVVKDGEVLKDKTRNPVSWKDAVNDYWIQKEWVTNDKGRGGGNNFSDPSSISKMSDLETHFEEKGINPLSQEARAMINEAAKSNDNFDFES